jgi:hypothetical protein
VLRGLSGGWLLIWGDALAEAAGRNYQNNYQRRLTVFMELLTWLRFGAQSASFLFKLAEYLMQ